MSPMFIWVMLCLNSSCACERVGYLSTSKELQILSSHVEIRLEKTSTCETTRERKILVGDKSYTIESPTTWILARQDTSYFYIQESIEHGLYITIQHVKGGRNATREHPKRIDYTVIVTSDPECFKVANKNSN
jgi:hypothetical protein